MQSKLSEFAYKYVINVIKQFYSQKIMYNKIILTYIT